MYFTDNVMIVLLSIFYDLATVLTDNDYFRLK